MGLHFRIAQAVENMNYCGSEALLCGHGPCSVGEEHALTEKGLKWEAMSIATHL